MRYGSIFFIVLWIGSVDFYSLKANDKKLDSLQQIIAKNKKDSNEVNALIELSNFYRSTSYDTSFNFAKEAHTLAESISFQKGLGYAFKALGLVENQHGNYVDALRYWKEGLRVFEASNNKLGAANLLNNIGTIYYNKSDETNALDFYLRSLKASEEIKDTLRIATALMNLGGVYSNKPSTYAKALDYHRQALVLSKKIGDITLIGGSNANIGEIYLNQQKLDSAIYYLLQAKTNYAGSMDLPYSLNVLGKIYRSKRNYKQAIAYHQQAYDTALVYDTKLDIGQALLQIAETYKDSNVLQLAIDYYTKAQSVLETIGLDESYDLKSVYQGLSDCYTKQNDFKKALFYQTKLVELKDKIYNIEVDKSLSTKLFAYEIDKKQGEINLQQEVISRQKLVRNVLIGGMFIFILFATVFLLQRNRISKEKKRSEELLLNILPEEVAEELKAKGSAEAQLINEVTVLFTDFKGFTQLSEKLSPKDLVMEINECFSAFDFIMEKHNIEKIKTIGDAYMAAGGLPTPNTTHANDVVLAALDIKQFMSELKARKEKEGKLFFEIRIGIHTGPVVAGIVGIKKFSYDIWGDTVNTASRMESSGVPGKINVSETTYLKIKDNFQCEHRGKIIAKGKGEIDMYFVEAIT